MEKEKGIPDSFAVVPQNAKPMATMCDKWLVKMEKALNLWVEDFNNEFPK